jgi:AP-1 complex subunit gamma-1
MLGYPTSFIQMTCVNLLASNKFTDKRIAYVALCVLMDEKSEVLLLTSHTIKKDLESNNQYIVATALNAIGEVATPDMCRDVSPDVIKLLSNNNPYIKKKAAGALTKIIRKCPELIDTVAEKLNLIFEDKNHGVLLCGLALVCQIFKMEPSFIEKYRKYLPHMIRYLKSLSSTNYAPEYDINGVTDPFLQVKLLETLYYFGKNNSDASEEMNDLLASLTTNTESTKNTGNAVLYELVRTIIGIDSNSGLKSMGSSILGKFLGHKDNNYKYIALNTLQEVAKIDLNSVQKHKNVILECLKDTDISIKRRALDLTYIIINSSNIKPIIKECLNFLLYAENEFKLELTTKLCQSLEKYSPSLKWEIDTLIKMLCLAGNFVSDETVSSVINLIVSTPELSLYAVHKLFIAMRSNLGQEGLIKVGVYILGELGDVLISNPVTGPENETISVSEQDVINLIDEINTRKYHPGVKEYLMNCYLKLITKLSSASSEHLKFLLEQETRSYHCEVQQRASEYLTFSQAADPTLKRDITKNVPNSKIVKESEVKK